MTKVLPGEIRQARAFLSQKGIRSHDISPHHFAAASKELKKPFRETLKYLALLLSGGSGDGPSPIATADKDRLDPITALGKPSPTQQMEYENGPGSANS